MDGRIHSARRVIIEAPMYGDYDLHLYYVEACLKDSAFKQENPICMHRLWPTINSMNYGNIYLRNCFNEWRQFADITVVYTDLDIDPDMQKGIDHANSLNQKIEYRTLPDWQELYQSYLKLHPPPLVQNEVIQLSQKTLDRQVVALPPPPVLENVDYDTYNFGDVPDVPSVLSYDKRSIDDVFTDDDVLDHDPFDDNGDMYKSLTPHPENLGSDRPRSSVTIYDEFSYHKRYKHTEKTPSVSASTHKNQETKQTEYYTSLYNNYLQWYYSMQKNQPMSHKKYSLDNLGLKLQKEEVIQDLSYICEDDAFIIVHKWVIDNLVLEDPGGKFLYFKRFTPALWEQ